MQRFAKEPEDTFALLGEPIELPCLIENKRGGASWARDTVFLAGSDSVFESSRQRYSMPDQQQQQQLSAAAAFQSPNSSSTTTTNRRDLFQANTADTDSLIDEQNSSHRTTITNSSLFIKNVSLADDDYFQCTVGPADVQHRAIKSKKIKLTVLDPPSKLTIGIFGDHQNGGSATFKPLQVSSSVIVE